MKFLSSLLAIFSASSVAADPSLVLDGPYLTTDAANRIADAIYWAEGGEKAHPAYGIKHIPVANDEQARRVCLNTIYHSWHDWTRSGRPNEFLVWLSIKYCPPSVDLIGNKNWLNNVSYFFNHPKAVPSE